MRCPQTLPHEPLCVEVPWYNRQETATILYNYCVFILCKLLNKLYHTMISIKWMNEMIPCLNPLLIKSSKTFSNLVNTPLSPTHAWWTVSMNCKLRWYRGGHRVQYVQNVLSRQQTPAEYTSIWANFRIKFRKNPAIYRSLLLLQRKPCIYV